jgi:hypothetical protein
MTNMNNGLNRFTNYIDIILELVVNKVKNTNGNS